MSIKKFIQNYLTRKNIRIISFLLLPLLIQLFVFKSNENQTYIPFILIGAYSPLLFNCKNKTTRYYFVLGLGIFIRLIAFTIGTLFIVIGKDYGMYNIIIGSIFLVFAIIAGIKMPYSITGMILINLLAYFFLNQNYVSFACGFMIFVFIEFIFHSNLQLLAPFSKKKFGLEGMKFDKANFRKSIALTVLTTVLIGLTVGFISLVEPFSKSYANERVKYERKIEEKQKIEEKNEKFIEMLDGMSE